MIVRSFGVSNMEFFKSPMNYIGGKYKLLKQIVPLFPEDIEVFVDLFCGGLDVSLNVKSNVKICNDLEPHIIDFYKNIQQSTGEEIHNKLMEIVKKYDLSKENADGFNQLRKDYNANPNYLMFYSLIAHSFNHQLRYNSNGEFNMPFGKNRSCYNEKLQERLKEFVDRIDNTFIFSNSDFRKVEFKFKDKDKVFVYVDPPYLITTATYNENGGWTEKEEVSLLRNLDKLNEVGIKFGLSNVITQNDKTNEILDEWSKKYTIHDLNFNYGNSSYHKKDRSTSDTREVFICNY